MNKEKFKVKLNSPHSVYFAGQQLKGQVTLVLTKKTKIRGIFYTVRGYGKCSWYDFPGRDYQSNQSHDKDSKKTIIYTGNEEYILGETAYIYGTKFSKPTEFETGTYRFEFTYDIKNDLPSSFKGKYGSIKYKMEFLVEKPWSFDEKYTVPITIVKSMVMPQMSVPLIQELTRNIGVFRGGSITICAEIPSRNVMRGSKVQIGVTVDNKSNTHVERMKFSIIQFVTYVSENPFSNREEIIELFKKETGDVRRKSKRSFQYELQVPYCQPSDYECSKIIVLRYEVQAEAILPGLYKNVRIFLPINICSHEDNVSQTQSMNRSNIGWNAIHPRIRVDSISEDYDPFKATSLPRLTSNSIDYGTPDSMWAYRPSQAPLTSRRLSEISSEFRLAHGVLSAPTSPKHFSNTSLQSDEDIPYADSPEVDFSSLSIEQNYTPAIFSAPTSPTRRSLMPINFNVPKEIFSAPSSPRRLSSAMQMLPSAPPVDIFFDDSEFYLFDDMAGSRDLSPIHSRPNPPPRRRRRYRDIQPPSYDEI